MPSYEVIARYRKKGENPFTPKPSIRRITSTIDDFVSKKDLERFARQATPRGYDFIEVTRRKLAY